jgi:hypothetical protein
MKKMSCGSSQLVLFTKYYYGDQVEEDEMCRSYETYEGAEKRIHNFNMRTWIEETIWNIYGEIILSLRVKQIYCLGQLHRICSRLQF